MVHALLRVHALEKKRSIAHRRRMMVGTAKGGTFTALRTIAQKEGWRSLYKGIGLTWAKQAPQYAVTFLAYDMIKEVLEV